ncbi:MAG: hypothetical protein RBR71_11535 [Gudongella sp.]|nr:hypothetical protein [Gudongella sp.]
MSPEIFDIDAENELLQNIGQHLNDMKDIARTINDLYIQAAEQWDDKKFYEFEVYMQNLIGELKNSYQELNGYYETLQNKVNKLTE